MKWENYYINDDVVYRLTFKEGVTLHSNRAVNPDDFCLRTKTIKCHVFIRDDMVIATTLRSGLDRIGETESFRVFVIPKCCVVSLQPIFTMG